MKRNEVWYHLYPLGFLGAEDRNPAPGATPGPISHRLADLVLWLDHLVELGVTGLLLGPVFESGSHGYDVVDPLRIDRRLGKEEDLLRLIDECHQRSLRVGLDVVFNHVGRGHACFVDVLQNGRESSRSDWFHIDFDRQGHDGFRYTNFEGHGQLVKLNHANDQVLDWAVDVARHWLQRGVDTLRLDAAYAIPAAFLAAFESRVRAMRPDLLLIGEVIHGDYVAIAKASRLNAVTQYELWKAIWSSLNERNFYELAHALERHVDFCRHFVPWNFVGNHDTTRIASKLVDRRHLAHALAILFTIPIMLAFGYAMERGLIKYFYKRPHADQILVTFGLAIVLQEIIKLFFGANPIQTPEPDALRGSLDIGILLGLDANAIIYPIWRLVYFFFSVAIIGGIFAFLQFTTFGMVVRAGMADRETVGLLGINIDRRFTIMFGIAAAVAGLAGVMYAPINSPNYHMGMDFLVLSFVVVVVGGMGSLPGAVLAGFLLGILESFASTTWATTTIPGINQIVIYLVAIIILLTRPRGLMGRKGVMED